MEKKRMNFDFEISKGADLITIFYHNDMESEVDISLTKYWGWVKRNGYHEWVNNYNDPSKDDGHGQDTGEYDFDDYFGLPYETLKKHLTDYLKKRLTQ